MRCRLVARFLTGAVTLGLVVGGLAACGGDEPDDDFVLPVGSSTTPEVSATPGFSTEEAAAAEEILDVYDDYRELQIELHAAPDGTFEQTEALEEFLTDPILGGVSNGVLLLFHTDVAREGRPTWDPTVTDVRLDDDPPSATLRDCLDATGWGYVDRDTGESLAYASLDNPVSPFPEVQVLEYTAVYVDAKDRWLFERSRRKDEQC